MDFFIQQHHTHTHTSFLLIISRYPFVPLPKSASWEKPLKFSSTLSYLENSLYPCCIPWIFLCPPGASSRPALILPQWVTALHKGLASPSSCWKYHFSPEQQQLPEFLVDKILHFASHTRKAKLTVQQQPAHRSSKEGRISRPWSRQEKLHGRHGTWADA